MARHHTESELSTYQDRPRARGSSKLNIQYKARYKSTGISRKSSILRSTEYSLHHTRLFFPLLHALVPLLVVYHGHVYSLRSYLLPTSSAFYPRPCGIRRLKLEPEIILHRVQRSSFALIVHERKEILWIMTRLLQS